MTPTYPEKMRLLGQRSWEEIESQQTDRQTDHRNSPPFSLASAYYTQFLFLNFFIPNSLAALGSWIINYKKYRIKMAHQNLEIAVLMYLWRFLDVYYPDNTQTTKHIFQT